MVTILDVAKHAGVSKSTVSRVLNDGYVDPKTRRKVERSIAELDYTPSSFAQNIRTRKSKTIAMMIPDSSNMFYMDFFKAAENIALEHEYMIIMCDTKSSPETERIYADKLLKRNIDGLLYFTQSVENEQYFVELSMKIPVVFMDFAFARNQNISCVATEGIDCSRNAVQFLYKKGKRKIAYINLPKRENITSLRCDGYRLGLKDCGLIYDGSLVEMPKENPQYSMVELGFWATEQLLKRNPDIDAIMTAADTLAIGAIKYLKSRSIEIPGKIGVMGFDDIDLCTVVEPNLTTIMQPIETMGREAANILINQILKLNLSCQKILHNGTIIEREST